MISSYIYMLTDGIFQQENRFRHGLKFVCNVKLAAVDKFVSLDQCVTICATLLLLQLRKYSYGFMLTYLL